MLNIIFLHFLWYSLSLHKLVVLEIFDRILVLTWLILLRTLLSMSLGYHYVIGYERYIGSS